LMHVILADFPEFEKVMETSPLCFEFFDFPAA
jgi:hypothetical protein